MASLKCRCMPSLCHLLHIMLGKARCCHTTLEPCMENCSSTVLACHFTPNPLVSSGSDLSTNIICDLIYTRSHFLPSSISSSNTGLYIYLPLGITIDSDWSVLWWCRRDFAETTPSKSIHHGEVSIIAPPSQFLLHDWHTAPSSSLCCQVQPACDLLRFHSNTAGIVLSFTPVAIHSSRSAVQAKEFLLTSTCVKSSI